MEGRCLAIYVVKVTGGQILVGATNQNMLTEERTTREGDSLDFFALDVASADKIIGHFRRSSALCGKRSGGGEEGDSEEGMLHNILK